MQRGKRLARLVETFGLVRGISKLNLCRWRLRESVRWKKKDAREVMTKNSLHDSIASQVLVRGI